MRLIAAIACLLAGILSAAPVLAAPAFDSPQALIDYAYKPYATGTFPDDPYELYSPKLKKMVDDSNALYGEDEVGPLDFDPFIDAQDYDAVSVETTSLTMNGDAAKAELTVTNFGEKAHIVFDLVKTATGWMIDDVSRAEGDYPWRLSEILAPPPATN